MSLFLNGEPDVARLILNDLVKATIGFEVLEDEADKSIKNINRKLSAKDNLSMDNLAKILKILREKLNVSIQVKAVHCH
jgi:hypothetical protein